MKPATANEPIAIADLRVGMFVHLDMGWMAHPFPLGSFRIASDQQIETIRSLGAPRVRWSRHQSDARFGAGSLGVAGPAEATDAADPAGPAGPADPAEPAAAAPPPADAVTRNEPRTQTPADLPTGARADAPTDPRCAARRLAAQRNALQRCERGFGEAAHACRQLGELVVPQPAEARASAEALTQTLLEKMQGAQELCLRLLTTTAGDKASAHALNVTLISLLMGRTVGLPPAEMRELGVGALLHDIGKIELPEHLRHRGDQLSAPELRVYEEHVAHGVGHARRMGLSRGATLVIAQHHEHADGSGFPLRLNADRLTAAARIVALVDRYDTLCNPPVAAKALTPHEALSLLFAQGRGKFDTDLLGAFIRMMGVYPAGSPVQLTDGRHALVVSVNSTRPLKPCVLVHDAGVPRDQALIVDLERMPGLGIRRSLKPLHLPAAALEYLAPRPRVTYFFEPADSAPGGAAEA